MPTIRRPIGFSALSASVETVCVDPERVPEIWPHVRPLVAAAIVKCGDWSEMAVLELLMSGRGLLWIRTNGEAIGGAGVTQLIEARHGLTCNVVVYAGACDDWNAAFAPIRDYAVAEQCAAIRIQGREGWKRVFPDFDLAWVSLEKRLG
jgi:hypothetical protein